MIFLIFIEILLRVFMIILRMSLGVFLLGVIKEYYKLIMKLLRILSMKLLMVVFIIGESIFFFYLRGGGVVERRGLFKESCFLLG